MNARFQRFAPVLIPALLFGCISAGSPMGVEYKTRTQFDSEWSDYLDFSPNKAMAIAGDVNGRYVLGYSHFFPVEEMAIAEALEACELRRADRNYDLPCRLYAIGDDTVDEDETTDKSRPNH